MEKELTSLAEQVGLALQQRHLQLTVAESCTGGWLAQVITAIPGSSNWFDRGFVTYSNSAKQEMLGVNAQTLTQHGAVSEQIAIEMAEGALHHSHAHVSIAITGIAGPDGGSVDKPVGTVWLAWNGPNFGIQTLCSHLLGTRQEIRADAVKIALQQLLFLIKNNIKQT